MAQRSATRIMRSRFFASSRAVSSSEGGKKIANAALTLPQNDTRSAAASSELPAEKLAPASAPRPNVTSRPTGFPISS